MALQVIGTARKPNKSDLRARGLTGLPDPSPEVTLLRAKLESEQAELRAMVGCYETGIPESFVRMDVDVVEINEVDVCVGNEDAGRSNQENNLCTESEGFALQMDENRSRVKETGSGSGDDVEKSSMLAASVVGGSCEPGKFVRSLRHRNPIQIHPYALEREGHRQLVKAGRRQAAGDGRRLVHGKSELDRKTFLGE